MVSVNLMPRRSGLAREQCAEKPVLFAGEPAPTRYTWFRFGQSGTL